MLLANSLSTFPIKSNLVFSNGSKNVPKNLPDFPILCNWFFDNFILAEKLFAKAFRSFETCILVNNNLCEQLFSSLEAPITLASPKTFGEIFKATSVTFFNPGFILLGYEVDSFTFKVFYWVILYWYYIKTK